MTFQQDDLFKKDNSFRAAQGFVAEIHGSFPGKAATGSQSFVVSEFSFQPKLISKKNSFLIVDRNIFIKIT